MQTYALVSIAKLFNSKSAYFDLRPLLGYRNEYGSLLQLHMRSVARYVRSVNLGTTPLDCLANTAS